MTSTQSGVTLRVTDIYCTIQQNQNSSWTQKKVTFRDTDINLKWSNFRVIDIYSTTQQKQNSPYDLKELLSWILPSTHTFILTRYRNEIIDMSQMTVTFKVSDINYNVVTFRVTDIYCTTQHNQNSSYLSQKKVIFRDTDINLKWSNFRVIDIYSTTLQKQNNPYDLKELLSQILTSTHTFILTQCRIEIIDMSQMRVTFKVSDIYWKWSYFQSYWYLLHYSTQSKQFIFIPKESYFQRYWHQPKMEQFQSY